MLYKALGKKHIGKPLVFMAFLKLREAEVLEKHWFSLLFEASLDGPGPASKLAWLDDASHNLSFCLQAIEFFV